MRLLDLFCGAGGASAGYDKAGFRGIVGVDIAPQPHYPFPFVQADALDVLREGHINGFPIAQEFDVIHASPPCQAYSVMTKGRWQDREHPELIAEVRELILATGLPYVIENVSGAKKELRNPFMLCGSMFWLETTAGNQLRRHRYFESNVIFPLTPGCRHNRYSVIGVYGGGQNPARRKRRPKLSEAETDFGINARSEVMGIGWMTGKELNEAIPPAYTQFIGDQLIQQLQRKSA